jgi:glycosyltransferase involved in cell wall biosynthesis
MVEQNLISCIVPVFNGERYLRDALESIFRQTYRPLEIIVVDDGSTDGSAATVASYGEQLVSLRQTNRGPAAARNRGLSAARGEFIAFLDQDDLWHPEKLARQQVRFQARPELDLCITYAQNFWIPELQAEAALSRDWRYMQPHPAYMLQALLARRTLFTTVGQFNSEFRFGGDDIDWFLRMAEQGVTMEVIPEVLTYHRLHQTNLSRVKAAAQRDWPTRVLKASLDRRRQNKTIPAPLKWPPAEKNEKP